MTSKTQSDEPNKNIDQPTSSSNNAAAIAVNVICTLLTSTSMGMLAILVPVQLVSLNFSDSTIGAILSFETIASLIICLFIPNFLKIAGLKIGLLMSTLIRVPTVFIFPYFDTLDMLAPAIFFHAVGCYTLFLLLQIWINTIQFDKNKGLMIAFYSTAISVGFALGPIIINILATYAVPLAAFVNPILDVSTEFFGKAPVVENAPLFVVAALLSTCSIVPLLLYLPNIPQLKFNGNASIFKTIKENKGAMFSISMAGVSQFGVAAFITIYGMKNGLSLSDSALLLTTFMMGSLLLEIPIAWLSDRYDRRYLIVWCSVACMICAAYLPLAIYTPIHAWSLVFIWGGVIAGIYSISLAIIGEKYSDNDEMIASNAGYSLMESIGGVFGIVAIGFSMQYLGSDGMPYVIMFASILYFSFALTRYPIK